MTLKERLIAKKAELKGLETKINDGDEEAIKSGTKLTAEIDDLEKQVKEADTALAKIAAIGTHEEPAAEPSEKPAKSLGENFVKKMKKPAKGEHFNIAVSGFKAAADPMTVPAGVVGAITTYDTNIVTAARKELNVRALFNSETVSGNTLTYFVEGAMEGAFAKTAEGAAKPQIHFADPTPKTVSLEKIAAFIKESDEYINDAPFLASAINGRLLYQLSLQEQVNLVSALLATSGIQTDTADLTSAVAIADAVRKAKKNIKKATGFDADSILINPDLKYILDIGKDSNGQYYGGGYFGNPADQRVWGLNVVESDDVTGVVIGAFKTCGSVVTNGDGQSVDATNTDADDFTKNMMTIRAEERLVLAVRRPAGFVNLTQKA